MSEGEESAGQHWLNLADENFNTMTDHAVAALLWSTSLSDEDVYDMFGPDVPGRQVVEFWDDVVAEPSSECREELKQELVAFTATAAPYLGSMSLEQVGHDFILTRNGHGVGFWDRGLGDAGDALTSMTKPFGGIESLYLDGRGDIAWE